MPTTGALTCTLQIDLGGCCGESSWLRPMSDLLGWREAFLERILMSVLLVSARPACVPRWAALFSRALSGRPVRVQCWHARAAAARLLDGLGCGVGVQCWHMRVQRQLNC